MGITPRQARDAIRANRNVIILDVRTRQEYQRGYIPGAISLPEGSLGNHAGRILPSKSAVIIVYCKSGSRSRRAANALASMGYTNVYDLGGIEAWPYDIVSNKWSL